MRRLPSPRLALSLLFWLACGLAATAQNAPVRVQDVRVGFPIGSRDFFRAGAWVPVAVEFAPERRDTPKEAIPATLQGELIVETPDSEGAQTRYVVPSVTVTRDDVVKGKAVLAYIKLGNASGEVTVTFNITQMTDERGNATRSGQSLTFRYPEQRRDVVQANVFATNQVRGDQRLILALGNVAGRPVANNPSDEDKQNYIVTQQTDPQRLPTQWFGYESVNVVILATGGTWNGSLAQVLSDTESLRGPLLQWVAQGGHLVIAVSGNAPQVKQSALSALYPAEIDAGKVQAKAELNELRAYLETQQGKQNQLATAPLTADIVSLKGKHPAVVMATPHKGMPLMIHAPFGLGRVSMLAFDVDEGGFATWPNNADFWKSFLGLGTLPEQSRFGYGEWNQASQPGMAAANTFATTLEQFGEMPVVSFFLVAVFILGYILLIGPIDYFFLKKVVKRLEWTWITFPTLVLVVSIGAYLAAYYIKGDEMRLNKVDVIDLDLAHRRVVGNTWVTVFSPNLQKYDLQLAPEGVGTPEGKPAHSWLGRPGAGPRGFDRQQSPGLFRRDYGFAPEAAGIQGVPIQVWGMKSFTARWQTTFQPGQLVEARVTLNDKLALTGEITSHLPIALKDCRLLYQNLFWELGTLEPGKPLRISASGTPRNTLNDFRPLRSVEVKAHGKTLADFAPPLSDLLYKSLDNNSANRPPYALDYLNQDWRLLKFEEAVLLATVDNEQGNAETLNAKVKVGTKLSEFKPALRGTLRQATYLRIFLPVEKAPRP